MEEAGSSDHFAHSLTDLMTSLMVIFILLLLVFVQSTGAKDANQAERVFKELQKILKPNNPGNPKIEKQDNRVYIIAPERLMTFKQGDAELADSGKTFLREQMPHIADVLYKGFPDSIESIVVEGHADRQAYQGAAKDVSRNKNLELSQRRAMEVVKTALDELKAINEEEQNWFIRRLSSSGRGQQDCKAEDEQDGCRKVVFVIRVQAGDFKALEKKIR